MAQKKDMGCGLRVFLKTGGRAETVAAGRARRGFNCQDITCERFAHPDIMSAITSSTSSRSTVSVTILRGTFNLWRGV